MIDLRTLVPLDMATIATSVTKTHRVVVAHEAVRNGGVGAEIAARIGTELFDELDAPVCASAVPSRRSRLPRSSRRRSCQAREYRAAVRNSSARAPSPGETKVALVALEIPKSGW